MIYLAVVNIIVATFKNFNSNSQKSIFTVQNKEIIEIVTAAASCLLSKLSSSSTYDFLNIDFFHSQTENNPSAYRSYSVRHILSLYVCVYSNRTSYSSEMQCAQCIHTPYTMMSMCAWLCIISIWKILCMPSACVLVLRCLCYTIGTKWRKAAVNGRMDKWLDGLVRLVVLYLFIYYFTFVRSRLKMARWKLKFNVIAVIIIHTYTLNFHLVYAADCQSFDCRHLNLRKSSKYTFATHCLHREYNNTTHFFLLLVACDWAVIGSFNRFERAFWSNS